MTAATQLAPEPDDEDIVDEEVLPIGNAWALHLLDDESASRIASGRVWNTYLRVSREHGHERMPMPRELTDAQVLAFRSPVHAKLAAERRAAGKEPVMVSGVRQHILEELRRNGPMSAADLHAGTDVSRGCVMQQLAFLRSIEQVVMLGKPRSRSATWALRLRSPFGPGITPIVGAPLPPLPAPKPGPVPPPPDSEPPPPAEAPVPIAARARRARRPAPRAPRETFADLVTRLVAEGRARRLQRKPSDPFVFAPRVDGIVVRFLGFIVRPKTPEVGRELLRVARRQARDQ